MKTLLFVDDEKRILKSLKRSFMDSEYKIYTALSGKEGLACLADHAIDLVISDMRMPEMDGYEFLDQVKKNHPHVFRIILSGYSDDDVVIQALNKNVAKLYLFKPWNNEELLSIIDGIFDTASLLEQKHLTNLINNTDQLPSIKDSYMKILNLIDQDASAKTVAGAIEKDQSITSKIIHVVNSAYYSLNTGSLRHATSYLGMNQIRDIVHACAIMDAFQTKPYVERYVRFIWTQSFMVNNILAWTYKEFLGKDLPDQAEMVGLLYNIGMVFFLFHYETGYYRLEKQARNEEDLIAMEEKQYQVNHYQVGAYLMTWWGMPYCMIEAALYHATPQKENLMNQELIWSLHLAIGSSFKILKNPDQYEVNLLAFENLGIKRDVFEAAIQEKDWTKEG